MTVPIARFDKYSEATLAAAERALITALGHDPDKASVGDYVMARSTVKLVLDAALPELFQQAAETFDCHQCKASSYEVLVHPVPEGWACRTCDPDK